MKAPANYFADGMDARAAGKPIHSCPLLFKSWPYDAWRLGWHYADVVRQVPSHYRHEGDLEENVKTPFEQGICHYYEGRSIYDCPYNPGSPDNIAWTSGWLAASEGRDDKTPEPVTSCSLSRRSWWLLIGVGLLAFWCLAVWAIF